MSYNHLKFQPIWSKFQDELSSFQAKQPDVEDDDSIPGDVKDDSKPSTNDQNIQKVNDPLDKDKYDNDWLTQSTASIFLS